MSPVPASASPARRHATTHWAAGPLAVLLTTFGTYLALPAAPAKAHDRLVRVDPAAGARTERAPAQVQLVFDQAVGRRFATVVVTGPDGADLAAGPARVVDGTVTQPLDPTGPSGAYTVAYRVVSADGHPVTGTSTYTVTAADASQAAASRGTAGASLATSCAAS